MVSSEGAPTFADREGSPSFRPEASAHEILADAPVADFQAAAGLHEAADVGALAAAAENERMIRQQVEQWNGRDFDAWEAALSPEVQLILAAEGVTLDGSRTVRDYAAGWAAAFPDAQLEITDVVAGSAGVSLEFFFRGTHHGPLHTPTGVLDPTGRHVEARGCWIFNIEKGKVRRARSYYDAATIMRQLGLLT